MHYLRSFASVLSAPVLYGVLCVPLLGLLYSQFPQHINAQGGTAHVPLLLATEVFQFCILLICGYAVSVIAPRHHHHHVVISTLLMLLIAVFVQRSFWDSVPVWHHLVFFASILVAMHLGSLIRKRQLLRAPAGS